MERKLLFLVMLAVSVLFLLTAGIVSAQDIDLDSMDKEQLLQLIQLIQKKLIEPDAPAESTPEPSGPVIPAETPTPEPRLFSIYENKKLIIEALPGYIFDRGETPEPDTNKKDGGGKKDPTPEVHDCPPGCSWFCPPQPSVLACGCWCG